MEEEWWESPTCWLCDWWWTLLIALVLALTAWFSRDLWAPYILPTPTVTPTLAPLPTSTMTPLPSPTLTIFPTSTVTATLAPMPTATRVDTLGTGDIQITLSWDSVNDLDIWVQDPSGELIYYGYKNSTSGGNLDVDANPGCRSLTSQPVENVFWPVSTAPKGTYVVSVNYFQQCATIANTPFTARVLVDGKIQDFTGEVIAPKETKEIIRFER